MGCLPTQFLILILLLCPAGVPCYACHEQSLNLLAELHVLPCLAAFFSCGSCATPTSRPSARLLSRCLRASPLPETFWMALHRSTRALSTLTLACELDLTASQCVACYWLWHVHHVSTACAPCTLDA